jgi:hypothetical protein
VKKWHWQHILKYRHSCGEVEYTMAITEHTNKDINKQQRKFIYIHIQGGSYFTHWFTALRFTAADAPLAARCIEILSMNQYACGQ